MTYTLKDLYKNILWTKDIKSVINGIILYYGCEKIYAYEAFICKYYVGNNG